MKRFVIAVDGIDGSGKSTFARRLLTAFAESGVKSIHISIDDFRQAVDWRAGTEAELYYDHYYDLAQLDAMLGTLLAGAGEVSVPVFDLHAEKRTGTRVVSLDGVAVSIIEGVFPLRVPSAATGMVVHLDTTEHEARRRIIARDLAKGRTREEIERRIDRRYFPSQERYRAAFRPRDRADIIIDNELPQTPRALKRDLERVPAALRATLDRMLPGL